MTDIRNSDGSLNEKGIQLSNSKFKGKPRRGNRWSDVPVFNRVVLFIGFLYTLYLLAGTVIQAKKNNEERRQRTEKILRDGSVRTYPIPNYTFTTETNKGTLHGWKYQCVDNKVRDNHNRVVLSSEGEALECTETLIVKL